MPTTDEIIISEEQIKKDDERFKEISAKKEEERTADEIKELGELKERYGKRMQKKIDKMNYELKTAQEEARKEKELREQREKELEEAKKEKEREPQNKFKEEYIEIDGDNGKEKWFTDRALRAKIDSGEITEDEAIEYKDKRIEAKAAERAYNRVVRVNEEKELEKVREEDRLAVLGKYPHFAKNHPNFNPEDRLYKLATEIWKEGYISNPKGLTLSIERAKQILGIKDTTIDRTEDLSLESSGIPVRSRKEEVTLTEYEEDAAIRMFTNVINPKTQKPYTQEEAKEKALIAKKNASKK